MLSSFLLFFKILFDTSDTLLSLRFVMFLSSNLDVQEDKTTCVKIINDMNSALKGRAVEVIHLYLDDVSLVVAPV